MAALGSVQKEQYEAAALDGAGPLERFWHVTVPGVRNAMLLVSALISASALRVFSEIYVLSGGTGGPGGQAMSLVMYIKQIGSGLAGQLGYASAMSVALFVLTIGPLLFVGWLNMGDAIKENLSFRRTSRRVRR